MSSTIWNTPRPFARSVAASAISSSSVASSVGMCLPSLERWNSVREVAMPIAPASSASPSSSHMRAMSAGVAGSRFAPRSPIT